MDERLRQHDEDALCSTCEVESVQDQASFNRFAETDFVCEQDTRHVAASDFRGDVKLMWNQVDTPAYESSHVRLFGICKSGDGLVAQVEGGRLINLSPDEAIFGFAEADRIREIHFCDFDCPSKVSYDPLLHFHRLDHDGFTALGVNGVAHVKFDALNGRIGSCIEPGFRRRRKSEFKLMRGDFFHYPEPELWLRFADPALSNRKFSHWWMFWLTLIKVKERLYVC